MLHNLTRTRPTNIISWQQNSYTLANVPVQTFKRTAVAFLCTRVKQPDVDDWKKLGRCIQYLQGSKELHLTLEADDTGAIQWWIDASFAVHPDMRSHTGITMSLGKGSPFSSSLRQKLNTKSSTEAELVGVDDGMALITWTRNFLTEQGFKISTNTVYQNNQSAILLERNSQASSGRRTRHINIQYFFVTDRVKNGKLRIEYCPTGDMWDNFFTKPLQGTPFRRQRKVIMNLDEDVPLSITTTGSQECVEPRKVSWADVVRNTNKVSMKQQGADVSMSNTSCVPTHQKIDETSNKMWLISLLSTNLI